MGTLGIVGGIGPESTIEYYRLALLGQRRRNGGGGPALPIVITSIDVDRVLELVEAGENPALVEYLLAEIGRLARAGAHVGLIAANTPHVVFDEIRERSPIPLVSIVEAACEEARDRGFSRLGLFGTRFTMRGDFYPRVFSRAGISVVVPGEEEQNEIHEKYVNELLCGIFLPETRRRLVEIAAGLKEREGIEALLLGGTELPLIFRGVPEAAVPLLDTGRIHVERALAALDAAAPTGSD